MPSRHVDIEEGRFGFNGKERDYEMGSTDFGPRMYNAGIGKFFKPDHLESVFSSYSPYSFALNSPIVFGEDGNKFVFVNDIDHKLEKAFYEAIGYLQGTSAGEYLMQIANDESIEIKVQLPEDFDNGFKGGIMTLSWDPQGAATYKSGFVATPTIILAHETRHIWQHLTDFGYPANYKVGDPNYEYTNPREKDAIQTWETEAYNFVFDPDVRQTRYSHRMRDQSLYLVDGVNSRHAITIGKNGGQIGISYDNEGNKSTTGGYKSGSRYQSFYGQRKVVQQITQSISNNNKGVDKSNAQQTGPNESKTAPKSIKRR